MARTLINFHNALERGEKPVPYVIIDTAMGFRVYGENYLSDSFDIFSPSFLADGSVLADGATIAGGGADAIDKAGKVLNFGKITRTISPKKKNLILAFSSKHQNRAIIELDNSDNFFSKLLPKEPFIGRNLSQYIGFNGTPATEHLQVFSGSINEIIIKKQTVVLKALEN